MMKNAYKRLGRLFGTYSFGNVAQNALSVLLIPVYTSILSPTDYGVLALMGVTVALVTRGVSSPIGHALNRFYYTPGYKSQNGVLVFNLFLILVSKIVLLSSVFLLLSPRLCVLVLSDRELVPVVQIYTGVLFLTPISGFLTSLLRLNEMAWVYVAVSIAQLILSAGVILYGLLVAKIGIFAPILGTIVGLGVVVVLSFPVFLRKATLEVSMSIVKEPLRYGYPMIVTGYSNLAIESGDRYVLRAFGSLGLVGLYSLGYKLSSLISILVTDPLKQGLLPIVLKLEENPSEQRQFLASAATHYYLVGVLMALGFSLFAREATILVARKPEFWAGWVIIPIISFSYVQHGLGNFVGWGLTMAKKSYYISTNVAVTAFVNLVLNVLFVPFWGIMGAAFATLISYIVWNWLKIYYSGKFYGLNFDIRRLGHISAAGFGLYLLSLVCASSNSMFLNLTMKSLIFLLYLPSLLITGFFSEKEKDYIQKVLSSIRTNGLRYTYAKIKAM